MLELLKKVVIKISETYFKLFKTWIRFVIFFTTYFLVLWLLPDKFANIIVCLFLAFVFIAISGCGLRARPKG